MQFCNYIEKNYILLKLIHKLKNYDLIIEIEIFIYETSLQVKIYRLFENRNFIFLEYIFGYIMEYIFLVLFEINIDYYQKSY